MLSLVLGFPVINTEGEKMLKCLCTLQCKTLQFGVMIVQSIHQSFVQALNLCMIKFMKL